jgi:hypothetical protein
MTVEEVAKLPLNTLRAFPLHKLEELLSCIDGPARVVADLRR